MLGNRQQMRDTIRDAAQKAGALVMVALAVACAALVLAAAAFVLVLRVRHAAA